MLHVGLIGAGTMGQLYAQALSEYPKVRLAAICDLDGTRASQLATKWGVANVLSDYGALLGETSLDAVVVATPDFAHTAPVLACLEAGKHVLVEKPLTTDAAEGAAIVAAAARAGRHVMVNYGNRHRPTARVLRRRIQAGELGRISYAYVRLNEWLTKPLSLAWLERTSPVWFLLSHCVDLLQWLLDHEITEVSCQATYGVLQGMGKHVPDGVVCTARLDGGALACFESVWILPASYPAPGDFRLELVGASGSVRADFFPLGVMKYAERAELMDWAFEEEDAAGIATGWWFKSVRYFVDCLESGEAPMPDAAAGLAVTRILLAMSESLTSGKTVAVAR